MEITVNRLFVYGIFLDEYMRTLYGMSNPIYDTVPDYITLGKHIAIALPVDNEFSCCLTGLLVDVDPKFWDKIDALESGYKRIEVETNNGHKAYMYAYKGGKHVKEN